jgi:hypothetical protein
MTPPPVPHGTPNWRVGLLADRVRLPQRTPVFHVEQAISLSFKPLRIQYVIAGGQNAGHPPVPRGTTNWRVGLLADRARLPQQTP